MASFVPSMTRQTISTLTATAQRRWMVIVFICFLLLASGSSAHSVKNCGKKELVVYDHDDANPEDVISASPSGNGTIEFGAIEVIDEILRKGIANDSTQLGRVRGFVTYEKDLSFFASFTLELTTPGCIGSLTTQGTLDPEGNGELVITGGTGAYRYVLGYMEVLLVTSPIDEFISAVFEFTIHLKYF